MAGAEPMPRDASASAVDVFILLEQFVHRFQHLAYAHGLKPAQWAALRYFARAMGEQSTSAFASYHGTSASAASQTIRSLLERELLVETRDQADLRRKSFAVSQQGTRLVQQDASYDLVRLLGYSDPIVLEHCRLTLHYLLEAIKSPLLAARNGERDMRAPVAETAAPRPNRQRR